MKRLTAFTAIVLIPACVSGQGQVLDRTLQHGGIQREYLLYVPTAYDGTADVPLVLNFHAGGRSSEDQVNVSQMNPVAEQGVFLVAYPQGKAVYNAQFEQNMTGWNVDGTLADHDDIDFVRALIGHIASDHAVDRSRVHATGYSFGGMFSFTLACRLADEIASIAVVSGNIWFTAYEDCSTERPLSVMLFHGTADRELHNGTDETASAAASVGYWAQHNGCGHDSTAVELADTDPNDGSHVVRIEYNDCDPGSEVVFYKIIGGGHTWPGGTSPFNLGSLNRDVDASATIWEFFSRNPKSSVGSESDAPRVGFQLGSAYPNPLNGAATVTYTLPGVAHVTLTLSDILGRQVRLLDSGRRWEGVHVVRFDSSTLAPGTYLVTLTVGEFRATRAMIKAK